MFRHPKPRFLSDIYIARHRVAATRHPSFWRDNFSPRIKCVNLAYGEVTRIPATNLIKLFSFIAAASILVFGSVYAPTGFNRAIGQSSDEERKALETELQKLEAEISQYEGQVLSYQKQGGTLKSEISRLNDKISRLNLQIQAINLTIKDLDRKITDTKAKISATEETISDRKTALGRLLQNLYENERVSLIEIFLKNPQISDFFGNLQGTVLLQDNLRVEIGKIEDLRDELQGQREQLSLARSDAATTKNYQTSQKREVDAVKEEKNKLLDITKGQESKYQALLKESKQSASEIRKRIFKLLGGGELSFGEAYQYAKLAGNAAGIRPAFILAVLDRESALGSNVGRCSYKTAMSPSNQQIFLEIVKELDVDPNSLLVSCPNKDGVYGGAMGPAQFIPSTWALYRDSVAKITGNKPASPWNNADAFTATALYLKDAYNSSACVEYSRQIPGQKQILQERCAAARYYAGSRWYHYRWTYGEAVVVKAQRFQNDIDTITS